MLERLLIGLAAANLLVLLSDVLYHLAQLLSSALPIR